MQNDDLMNFAKQASEKAYAPYSKFCVGAALVCKSGRIFSGCNVESSSYGATICAERTALVKAISEGEREFDKIAVYTKSGSSVPCGICRQILSELAPNITVIYTDKSGMICEKNINDLLPDAFNL